VAIGVYPQPILQTSQRDIAIIADIAQRARGRAAAAAQATPEPGPQHAAQRE
jgi:hypothetical protein